MTTSEYWDAWFSQLAWGFWILFLGGVIYAVYLVVVSLPLRRRERARFFLDLLALGLKRGLSPVELIRQTAQSRDSILGPRFQLLATCLERGLSLGQALDRVPDLLPPQMNAILKAGDAIRDVPRVLPACETLLKDDDTAFIKAQNYLAALPFAIISICMLWIVPLLIGTVLTKFSEIGKDMEIPAPPLMEWIVRQHTGALAWVILTVAGGALILLASMLFIIGPRGLQWLESGIPQASQFITWLIPWKRDRLLRDFTGLLASFLDAGLPESAAVQLAADATHNQAMVRQAALVRQNLAKGIPLMEALGPLTKAAQLKWRLENAAHGAGFVAALAGWGQALDAAAFAREQTWAQTVTAALILFNGLCIGAIAVAVFQFITSWINSALLW